MPDRFRVSNLLKQKLLELGVSPEAVLRGAGLPPGLFEQEKICLSTDEFFALYEAIGAVSDDPAVGLRLGAEDRVERYSPVAIAALYARSFRDALGRAARYKQLTCPEAIEVAARGGECVVRFRWTLADHPEPAILVDLCFAWLLAIGRRGTGLPLTPLRVEFKRKAARGATYERFFGCAVRFGAARNALVFRASDLDLPFATHNPELLAMIAPQLERELAQRRRRGSARDEVKTTVKRLLAGRRPDVREVAKDLLQSPRTMQRRLAADGTTFQDVLEEARNELAQHYLLHSTLELTEVAYLLGYEDANSFFRAFRSWQGVPPGRWRERRRGRRAV